MRKCDKKRTLRRRALGRGSRTRTHDQRFWRPRLYQLSYTPVCFFAFAVFASRIFHGKSDYIITCKINQEFFSFCHGFSLFGRTVRRDTGAIRVQFIHACLSGAMLTNDLNRDKLTTAACGSNIVSGFSRTFAPHAVRRRIIMRCRAAPAGQVPDENFS